MHIVGLDIGFSERRKTNAIAVIADGELSVEKLGVHERNRRLANLRDVDVIAIDAPVVSSDCAPETARHVERVFCRGLFQKRCKPGMSHIRGTGRTLREHGGAAAQIVAAATLWRSEPPFPTVIPRHGIVEAFPNAFLGVALDDSVYAGRRLLVRGGKFDWLYDEWVTRGLFATAVTRCGLPLGTTDALTHEQDHEKRAALVCLLTAAFALTNQAEAVGDSLTGYFFLPSRDLWADWA